MDELQLSDSGLKMFAKVIFNILGTVFLGLAILGVILPLMPATPFLLLAAACYVRGSQTLYNWLMSNKYLGPYITNFKNKRGMPIRAKIVAIVLLWASLLFSIYRLNSLALISTLLVVAILVVGIGVTTLILKLKTLEQS
jgi:uncharacterized membrane protein YbaN (DUF454 family)